MISNTQLLFPRWQRKTLKHICGKKADFPVHPENSCYTALDSMYTQLKVPQCKRVWCQIYSKVNVCSTPGWVAIQWLLCIAMGCHQMASIEHVHQETKVLLLRTHCDLLTKQYASMSCARSSRQQTSQQTSTTAVDENNLDTQSSASFSLGNWRTMPRSVPQ